MKTIAKYDKIEHQFRSLKSLSNRLSTQTGLDVKDVESFILKKDFLSALLYSDNTELFVHDFTNFMHETMGVSGQPPRRNMLNKRIWGPG